jgi:hypothetical protein
MPATALILYIYIYNKRGPKPQKDIWIWEDIWRAQIQRHEIRLLCFDCWCCLSWRSFVRKHTCATAGDAPGCPPGCCFEDMHYGLQSARLHLCHVSECIFPQESSIYLERSTALLPIIPISVTVARPAHQHRPLQARHPHLAYQHLLRQARHPHREIIVARVTLMPTPAAMPHVTAPMPLAPPSPVKNATRPLHALHPPLLHSQHRPHPPPHPHPTLRMGMSVASGSFWGTPVWVVAAISWTQSRQISMYCHSVSWTLRC